MKDLTFNGDDLIAHIGLSVHHPFFQQVLRELNQETPVSKESPYGQGVQIDKIWVHSIGMYFDFTTPFGYLHHTGNKVKEKYTNDKYELILSEVNFNDERKVEIKYPFGLTIGDDLKTISKKIGRKQTKKYKSNGSPYHLGYICYYYTESYTIITYLTTEKKLLSLNVQFLRAADKKYHADTTAIKTKTSILLPGNIHKIQELKNALPVRNWVKREMEGDHNFTAKNLKSSEKILVTFIEEVLSGIGDNSHDKIRKAVRKVVKEFNKLNVRHNNFIETLEREELAAFINKVAILSGLTENKGSDITEEWREW